MSKSAVDLREERAGLVGQARALLKTAEDEQRELTAEESESYDRTMADVDAKKLVIDRLERIEAVETELEVPTERASRPLDGEERVRRGVTETTEVSEKKERDAFRHWMRTGEVRADLAAGQRRLPEYRDTIIGTDAKGGYLIAPVQVTKELVKAVDDQVFVRKLATVRKVTEAKKLGIRKLATRMADADWTTEVGPVVEDTTAAFDRRDLEPYLLTKLAKASLRTLMLSTDAEAIIRNELAYRFAITQEKAFMTGNGTAKPLGVFVASASGISTARDVACASATAIAADDLINVKYSLKAGYSSDPSLAWIFHRDAIKSVRKLKTTTSGDYVWAPGLASGEPDRILDVPFYMSEYAPNTFTTGLYVGILGAFRYYWIAEVVDFVIQRLVELYAATNEVGFIGRIWVDGAPVLEEAFARVKLA